MNKLKFILQSFLLIFIDLPIRLKRLILHFLWILPNKSNDLPQIRIVDNAWEWLLFLPFYILDILGIPNLYQILLELIFFRIRHIKEEEYILAYPIFRNSIRYQLVRINERENIIASRLGIAYVSFSTIQSGGLLSKHLLVHELMHIWQYEQFGSVYIIKALKAQRSEAAYNYGGRFHLNEFIRKKQAIYEFNFEQQGEIVEDFYLLSIGKSPTWIDYNLENLSLLKVFIKDLIKLKRFSSFVEMDFK